MLDSKDQIQYLLNYLAEDIVKSDLDHISGLEIYNGNIIHIKSFLQILDAIVNDTSSKESKDNS